MMPIVKVLMIPITGPGDLLKVQDLIAEALKSDLQNLHGIGCACDGSGCGKRLVAHDLPDGRTTLTIQRGAQILEGIVLDRGGKARLVEQLGGTMGV